MPSPFPLNSAIVLQHDYSASFYVRMGVKTGAVSLIKDIGARAEAAGVSISSIKTDDDSDTATSTGAAGAAGGSAQVILTTCACTLSAVTDLAHSLKQLPYASCTAVVMPML